MTSNFSLPILVLIRPSRWQAAVMLAVHAGAMLALGAADLSGTVKSIVMAPVVISLVQTLSSLALQPPPATPVVLMLTANAEWWLTCADGRTFSAQLMPGAFVHPLLTVLSFKGEGCRRYNVIITPDMIEKNLFRRLRVRLKFQV